MITVTEPSNLELKIIEWFDKSRKYFCNGHVIYKHSMLRDFIVLPSLAYWYSNQESSIIELECNINNKLEVYSIAQQLEKDFLNFSIKIRVKI